LKLLFGKSKKEAEVKVTEGEDGTVLFVCVENAGRSQMAEAFFRKYAPRGYMTVSGGTRPVGEINPIVIQAMKEIGIDISKQKPKIITEDMIRNADVRVNMGRCMVTFRCEINYFFCILLSCSGSSIFKMLYYFRLNYICRYFISSYKRFSICTKQNFTSYKRNRRGEIWWRASTIIRYNS
jgi:Low molecular weight phosphotyrosine protein phosphatase